MWTTVGKTEQKLIRKAIKSSVRKALRMHKLISSKKVKRRQKMIRLQPGNEWEDIDDRKHAFLQSHQMIHWLLTTKEFTPLQAEWTLQQQFKLYRHYDQPIIGNLQFITYGNSGNQHIYIFKTSYSSK